VIVRDGIVIARGWTQPGGRPHAEAHALAQLAPGGAAGATVYVTLEPCAHRSERGPACADVLAEALPARVVIGIGDPDPRTSGKGITRLVDAGMEVTVLDDAEARESLAGFLVREEQGRMSRSSSPCRSTAASRARTAKAAGSPARSRAGMSMHGGRCMMRSWSAAVPGAPMLRGLMCGCRG